MTNIFSGTSGTIFDGSTGITTVNLWPTWNNQWTVRSGVATTAATNAVITIAGQTWQGWNQTYQVNPITYAGTGTITINTSAWKAWNNIFAKRELTAEEKAAEAQARLRAEEEAKKARLEAEAAKVRARKLLFGFLTDEQKREAEEFKRFHLTTRSGRRFRLHMGRGRHGNVKELEGDKEVRSYCISPDDHTLPEEDALLAQLLALKHDEAEFVRVANITRVA